MMTKLPRPFRPLSLVAAALCGSALFSGSAPARDTFDGVWAVEIVASAGDCPARVIPISVEDGRIRYSAFGASAEGAIAADGSLSVNFAHAQDVVRASGAVDAASGSGSWRSTECAGSWTARRG
jgi:hypothetical protein